MALLHPVKRACVCLVRPCVQVDSLTQQLSEAQQTAADKGRLEGSLASADRARREAEEKLAAALRHNAATARDLATLQVRFWYHS